MGSTQPDVGGKNHISLVWPSMTSAVDLQRQSFIDQSSKTKQAAQRRSKIVAQPDDCFLRMQSRHAWLKMLNIGRVSGHDGSVHDYGARCVESKHIYILLVSMFRYQESQTHLVINQLQQHRLRQTRTSIPAPMNGLTHVLPIFCISDFFGKAMVK